MVLHFVFGHNTCLKNKTQFIAHALDLRTGFYNNRKVFFEKPRLFSSPNCFCQFVYRNPSIMNMKTSVVHNDIFCNAICVWQVKNICLGKRIMSIFTFSGSSLFFLKALFKGLTVSGIALNFVNKQKMLNNVAIPISP